ncbi:MAG: hypothetical protein WAZ78_00265 [Candidatus Moraniibacteriota bacterium]
MKKKITRQAILDEISRLENVKQQLHDIAKSIDPTGRRAIACTIEQDEYIAELTKVLEQYPD